MKPRLLEALTEEVMMTGLSIPTLEEIDGTELRVTTTTPATTMEHTSFPDHSEVTSPLHPPIRLDMEEEEEREEMTTRMETIAERMRTIMRVLIETTIAHWCIPTTTPLKDANSLERTEMYLMSGTNRTTSTISTLLDNSDLLFNILRLEPTRTHLFLDLL